MNLVVDANILVAELLRERGHKLISNPQLKLYIAAKPYEESIYELEKRVKLKIEKNFITEDNAYDLLDSALKIVKEYVSLKLEIVYIDWEDEARKRIPSDPDDWHTVALAMELKSSIWTEDKDFFGCGLAVWRTEILLDYLTRKASLGNQKS